MANVTGGSIVWNLDIDDKQFNSKLASSSTKAQALGSSMNKTLSGVDFKGFSANAASAFDSVARGLGKIVIAGVAAGTGLAFILSKAAGAAFEQVRAVENASFALKAYEKDGAKVTKVLGELVAFARSDMGVLFQRDELFKAASNLRGFGEASDTLTDKVKILARGVSLGMITFDEFSQVVGRAASKGRLDADQYDILAGRGIILDKAFRGAAVSSEGLFKELQRVLPAELLEGRANTIDGVFIRLNSAFRDLGSAILGVDKDTSQFIKGGLGDTLIQSLNSVRDALKDPQLIGSLKSLGSAIGEFVKEALPKVIDGFKWFLDNKEAIGLVFASIVAGFVAAKVAAIAFSIAASANPIGLIAAAIAALVIGLTYLQLKFGIFTTLWQALQPIIQPIVNIFKQLWAILMEQLAPAFEFIARNAEVFKKIGLVLLAVVLIPLVVIIGSIVAAALVLIAVFAAIAAAVRVVYNAFLSLKAAQEAVAQAIANGIKRIWNSAVDGFNGIIRAISGFVSRFVQVGSDIINGIVRGIQNGANAVIDTIKRIASGALDAVKKFFGIKSPSKVMAGIGKDLMAGMANGITSSTNSVVSSAQGAAESILGGFGSITPTLAPNVAGSGYVGANTTTYITNVTQNNSGIVAQSRSAWREINKDGIEAVNEELRSKGVPEIGGGNLSPGSSTI